MKRLVSIITIAAILSLMLATFVFADGNADVPQWFKDMISWKKAQVDQAEKDGTITKAQAELYRSWIDQMEKFHTENGFPNRIGPGGFGGCGFGRGMMGFGYR